MFLQKPNAKRQMHPGIWVISACVRRCYSRGKFTLKNYMEKMHPLPSVGA